MVVPRLPRSRPQVPTHYGLPDRARLRTLPELFPLKVNIPGLPLVQWSSLPFASLSRYKFDFEGPRLSHTPVFVTRFAGTRTRTSCIVLGGHCKQSSSRLSHGFDIDTNPGLTTPETAGTLLNGPTRT
ncbi:hypothetical protein J6590_067626 [Homalodisca vitripennis]|nr:hypothetical protein J6590_067626 [Homalodisca vitripennis]